jgi:hypothetical protein
VKRYETVRGESLIVESRQSFKGDRQSIHWKTTNGTILQSYEYGPGAPHRWNERSVEDGLHDVFMNGIANESVRAEWQRPQSSYDSIGYVYLGDGTFCGIRTTNQTTRLGGTTLEGELLGETWLHVQGTDSTQLSDVELFCFIHDFNLNLRTDDQPLPAMEVLRHRVFRLGYTLVPRFDTVCVVPICSAELASEDPTGVMQVQFSEDSSQQKEWLDLHDCVVRDSSCRQRMENLFAGSSIEIDTSFVADTQPLPFKHRPTQAPHLRCRRDILGLCLWYHGYRVEQQGNSLTILPQAAAKPGP